MSGQYPKSDWKLFREKLPGWQEAYMDRLNKEYMLLLSGEGAPSDKFWKLEKRIRADKKSPGVRLQIGRIADLPIYLFGLLYDGVIGIGDLNGFSDDLRNTMQLFYESQFPDWLSNEK